jgi:hypothetical protein
MISDNKTSSYDAFRFILHVLSFCLLIFIAYASKNHEFNKTAKHMNGIVPFDSYSFSQFANIQNTIKNKKEDIKYDDRKSPNFTKYALKYAYKIKQYLNYQSETNQNIHSFIRYNLKLYASFTAGIIFLILTILNTPYFLAFSGGLLYVVSPAAINKLCGLNISDSYIAIPLILTFYLFYFRFKKSKKTYNLCLLACFLLLTLTSSQIAQINLLLFGIYIFLSSLLLSKKNNQDKMNSNLKTDNKKISVTIFITTIIAAIATPYLRNIHFITSPIVTIILPMAIIFSYFDFTKVKKKYYAIFITVFLICLWYFYFSYFEYLKNYSYLLKLLKIKILQGNIKPINPDDISFVNRVLWNSPLKSATFNSYWQIFHFTIYIFISEIFIIFLYVKSKQNFFNQISTHFLLIFLIVAYFLLFIYFEFFSLYVIPFLCISIILLFQNLQNTIFHRKKYIISTIIICLILFETDWSLKQKPTNYISYAMTKVLNKWLQYNNLTNRNILCDYSFTPFIITYSNAKSLFSEKLQNKKNIDKIQEFYKIMYFGTEKQLERFCTKNGINYFIFSKNMSLGNIEEKILYPYSKRYIGNCFKLVPSTPAYKMYYTPRKLNSFYLIDQKLPVVLSEIISFYKFISQHDKKTANGLLKKSQKNIKNGNINQAKNFIDTAIELEPNSPNIRFLYYQLYGKWPFVTINGVKGEKLH